jgi:hypothetical protein
MERWTLHLALHGTLALLVSLVAGLLLHRAIRLDRPVAAWHLAHAGTSGRAVMLIALAAIVHIIVLPPVALAVFVWLMLAFVWTSVAAMVLAASRGADRSSTARSSPSTSRAPSPCFPRPFCCSRDWCVPCGREGRRGFPVEPPLLHLGRGDVRACDQ